MSTRTIPEDKIIEYAIALQRAVEYHCHGEQVPPEVAAKCPHHARMLNDHLAAESDRIDCAVTERDEVVPLLEQIREFARMNSSGPAVYDSLWAVKEMADTFIMRNADPAGAGTVENDK